MPGKHFICGRPDPTTCPKSIPVHELAGDKILIQYFFNGRYVYVDTIFILHIESSHVTLKCIASVAMAMAIAISCIYNYSFSEIILLDGQLHTSPYD